MLGVRFDLLSHAHDAQIDAAIEGVKVALLAQVKDSLARQRPVRMRGERLEQIELERCHRNLLADLIGQPMGGQVEHAAADANSLGAQVGSAR